MTGQCQNGGCERLATIEVTISGVGRRHLCHFCHQALTPLFGEDMRTIEPFVPAWRQRSMAKDLTYFDGAA